MTRFLAIGAVAVAFVVVILPLLQSATVFTVAVQMDRSCGEVRRSQQFFGSELFSRPDEALWLAEYATVKSGDWVTVYRHTGRSGPREHWRWGGVYSYMKTFGTSIEIMQADDLVTAAAAQELLRLISASDEIQVIQGTIEGALDAMWERVDLGETLTPDGVKAAFRSAEAETRARTSPSAAAPP